MAADLHDLAVAVADRLEHDEPEFSGDVPDLMQAFREGQIRARERYADELAAELERALTSWLGKLNLDAEDTRALVEDLAEAAKAENASEALARAIWEWTATGYALADTDRREVLTRPVGAGSMLPVHRPS